MVSAPPHPLRPLGTAAVVGVLVVALLPGCAAWRRTFESERMAAEERRYGATADRRIELLAERAAAARRAAGAEQDEFCSGLSGELLQEHDPRVRCAIVDTAATFDAPAALAICRGALEDPDERVRMAACTAWRKRGGPEAVELLAARYRSDREIAVRLKALKELGQLGDSAAVPVLAQALEDPNPAVQYRAVGALKRVSGRDLGDDVNKWREWAADPEGTAPEWSIAEQFRKLF